MIIITKNENDEVSATAYTDESFIPENLENAWIVNEKDLPKSPIHTWEIVDDVVTVSEEKLALYKRSQYPKLTRYQFMRGLLEYGYKPSDIEAQIMLIEDEYTRELTMIGFKDVTNFVRTDPSIDVMRDMLKRTDLEIDEFWERSSSF